MKCYGKDIHVLMSATAIQERIGEMAATISRDYAGKEITLIGVMKGALFFLVDLAKAIDLPVTIELLGVSSYQGQTKTSENVHITHDIDRRLNGRHVILVEDIVDTGLTMQFLLQTLQFRHPASLKSAVLLTKPTCAKVTVPVDYTGFHIDDVFVVGYGMDFQERYRNLPFIGVIHAMPPALSCL